MPTIAGHKRDSSKQAPKSSPSRARVGRRYTAYYTLLSPYSTTIWLTGYYGAQPGDIDSLDTSYRANNSLVYMSPKFYGFTVGGSHSFGGVAGATNRRSTWSAAIQYLNGPATDGARA